MIKVIHSFQNEAPILRTNAGDLINLLDAVLINGFGEKQIDHLTSVDFTATATIDAGHSYKNGDILRISGADQDVYNGDYVIYNCNDTEFSYTLLYSNSVVATGIVKCKISPLGWTSSLSGENKKVYSPNLSFGKNIYFRVEDNGENSLYEDGNSFAFGTQVATIEVYESMLDINNGIPEIDYRRQYILKDWDISSGHDPQPWVIIGNDKCFYLLISPNHTNPLQLCFDLYFLGEFKSFAPNDNFNFGCFGRKATIENGIPYITQPLTSDSQNNYPILSKIYDIGLQIENQDYTGGVILKDYSGTITRNAMRLTSGAPGTSQIDSWSAIDSSAVPLNLCDNAVYYHPIYILEEYGYRGILPGAYCCLQRLDCSTEGGKRKQDLITIDGIERQIMSWIGINDGAYSFDITGPWF